MTEEGNQTVAEKLMGALITKMENMDSDLKLLKQENQNLRQAIADPMVMLKKAGFVTARTSMPSGVLKDDFRSSGEDMLVKQDGLEMPTTNAEFHNMEWSDIHELAEQAKNSGNLGNNIGIE